jgi:DNA-directed RNA polymerase subunit beta
LGDFPMMTESGTFIINGVEKVIVSQIRRSPGAYLSETMDKTGKLLYKADLIPMRGTWLEFESDIKDVLTVRIDRQRKMYSTIFLKAIGLEDPQQILDLFGDREALRNTLERMPTPSRLPTASSRSSAR